MCIKKSGVIFLTKLRDKKTEIQEFREQSNNIAQFLALRVLEFVPTKKETIQTPVAETQGAVVDKDIVLIPILRSGIALLPSFLEVFPRATVGIVGLRRDEKTAQAHWYYENLPPINHESYIIVLDPMIATGGTGCEVLKMLKKHSVAEANIIFVSIISAPEGLDVLKKSFPEVTYITVACDEKLNAQKFIVPGLGDFGDRFFGTLS